ncbi:carboxymuconolactone decarboxylase family protein [Nisaea acidiphila]|uniref:Carboxymuconolactone decarboxylase family protein n=1 Tax=Nisaea acidiphila TaxID=1862145 RepID=A0A9J7AWD9_9PROT|nr:carboxymuconolactone decarboxylase family protein [Nisaea acidiphila]UUX50761.1 carboxymuconolactone decarboxylase family protein [Nisaea acidiphila]
MARVPALKPEDMNDAQRVIHDAIVSGPRGKVEGPLKVWLHSPALADKAQQLGQFARYDSSLEPRLSELAIMVTGRFWGAQFEWSVHKPFALKAGISEAVLDAIRDRRTPPFEKEDERVVHDVSCALHETHKIGDALYAEALEVLGQQKLIDLVGVLGYYTLISMTINAFDVPLEGDQVAELD